MKMSFVELILLGIPEGISVAILAFVISKIKIKWDIVIIIGFILSTAAYLLRLLPITFGVHTIVYIALLILMLYKFGQVNIITSIINSIGTLLCLIVLETITSVLIMNHLQINQAQLSSDLFVHMQVFYPHVILLLLISLIIKKYKRMK
ncbi:MAG: hypothetical protein ACOWWO_12880 [Peptococcaceae bacterium]